MNNDPQYKVLIVDDEPAARWMLAQALIEWGYAPLEAGTGAAALAALDAEKTAAVLLDINLPDNSGLDLLREIKRRQPQTAVIMVTAQALYENVVAALRGGADDFISKPINLDELRFAIERGIHLKLQGREPVTVSKPRVLVISDLAERIPSWLAAFNSLKVETACVMFPEEWNYVSSDRYDLAVVDVCPALLEPLLKNLRASREHKEIPILVENERIAPSNPVGLLPKYRAMPGSHEELISLARRRITSITAHSQPRGLL